MSTNPPKKPHTACPQRGTPGKCFNAQVFGPDGESIATFDSTADPAVAYERALVLADALNRQDCSLRPSDSPDPLRVEFEAWAIRYGFAYRNTTGFWFHRNGGDGLFEAFKAGRGV